MLKVLTFFVAAALAVLIIQTSSTKAQACVPTPGFPCELEEGGATFQVLPLLLIDISTERGDYCGNPIRPESMQLKLNFRGDKNFLNIRWRALDPGGIERQIGVTCWLNCRDPGTNIETDCQLVNDFGRVPQKCYYEGPTGDHSCTIQGPIYNYNMWDGNNTVHCKFVDLEKGGQFLPFYPNATFWAIDFNATAAARTTPVGINFNLPIDVRYNGLVPTSFSTTINPEVNDGSLLQDETNFQTDNLICGDVARAYPEMKFLVSRVTPYTMVILASSNEDPTTCPFILPTPDPANCGYLGNEAECANNKCWKRSEVDLNAGLASLPEYGTIGFIVLMLAASMLFAAIFRRR